VYAPRGRRALIAEDSLTARIFLSRLLQAQGFEVRAVERAAELRNELAGAWTLVCVDVELPDARGPSLVEEVVHSQEGRPTPAAVIALVRDRADTNAAAMAGVRRVLHKPYDMDAVARMLERIGVTPRAS
jgi:DNA-binding response OmpR family regulator